MYTYLLTNDDANPPTYEIEWAEEGAKCRVRHCQQQAHEQLCSFGPWEWCTGCMSVADRRTDGVSHHMRGSSRQKGDNVVLDVVDDEHALLGPWEEATFLIWIRKVHRQLYKTWMLREIHTKLMYFSNVVAAWSECWHQFDSGIWAWWLQPTWVVPILRHSAYVV